LGVADQQQRLGQVRVCAGLPAQELRPLEDLDGLSGKARGVLTVAGGGEELRPDPPPRRLRLRILQDRGLLRQACVSRGRIEISQRVRRLRDRRMRVREGGALADLLEEVACGRTERSGIGVVPEQKLFFSRNAERQRELGAAATLAQRVADRGQSGTCLLLPSEAGERSCPQPRQQPGAIARTELVVAPREQLRSRGVSV